MTGLDPDFVAAMKENEPISRASFLSTVYGIAPEDFKGESPDEMLVREFDKDVYVELANRRLVPIAAVPAGIVLS